MTDNEKLRQDIEHAIRTTLIVLNKQSIKKAVDKIINLLNNDR